MRPKTELESSDVARAIAQTRFELIPVEGAEEQAGYLPKGAKVAVTCSPSLDIEATLRLSEHLCEQGLRVAPHISARMIEDRSHLKKTLQRLKELGLREIYVIGGDAKIPLGPFDSAGMLLEEMSHMDHGVEEIGIAAYPESHPLIDDAVLAQVLQEKQRFASYMVTQICFDPSVIVEWISDVRRRGNELPVYIGLPGSVDQRKLLKISTKIGIGDSARFLKKQTGLVGRLFKPGGYKPDALIKALAPYLGNSHYGIKGFHLNTFNQVESTERWRERMLDTIDESHQRSEDSV